jgi:hypothetical protein
MFWITGLLGLALGLAPFVLGYAAHGIALWTSLILGAIIVLFSIIGLTSAAEDKRWVNWVVGLAGLAALIAPFIFGYSNHAQPLWAGLILGVLLAILDGYKVFQTPEPASHH